MALSQSYPLDQVVDVRHRPPLATVARDRETPRCHHREEAGLPCWLPGPVEPRRPDDDRGYVAPLMSGADLDLGMHLGLAVAQVGPIGLVLTKRITGKGVGAEG